MIFIAKNEDGIPTWKLIQDGKKIVTRRLKPMDIGKEFAIQPGRGKFAVCRCKVKSCRSHLNWLLFDNNGNPLSPDSLFHKTPNRLEAEAQREGFKTWSELDNWFKKKGISIANTYRIEFELVN